ncbi:SRPBCC domain-containing protein [Saccharomonospora sp. NPDC006951]
MTTAHHFGTLGISEGGAFRIRFERTLRHPVAKVWLALTDEKKRQAWLPGCVLEPEVGARVRYDFGEEGAAEGVVTKVEAPGERGLLEHTWLWEGVPASTVRWTVEPHETGTLLSLTHSEVERAPSADFAVGWHFILDTLGRFADDVPFDDVWDDYETVAAEYQRQAA